MYVLFVAVHSRSKEIEFSICIFDIAIIGVLKQAFHVTFIWCFVITVWNLIYIYDYLSRLSDD